MIQERFIDKTKALLELAKKRQQSRWNGYNCIGDYHDGVYECDFVSPYSKSASNINANVMIILQDWSSHDALKGNIDKPSIEFGHTPSLPTNRYLKDLLKRHFQLDLKDTYTTNLFPFIKKGNMSSYIPVKDFKLAATEFTLPQIDIISPKIVICLGLNTYNAIRRATSLKPLKNLKEAISNPFMYKTTKIFCQSHTGQLGRNNRNKGGVDRVNEDWKQMSSEISGI